MGDRLASLRNGSANMQIHASTRIPLYIFNSRLSGKPTTDKFEKFLTEGVNALKGKKMAINPV